MTFCKPTIFQGTIRTLLFVAFLSLACPTNGEQWQEDALKKEGVIPEIIDSVKAYPLNITYGDGVEVKYGNLIKPTLAGSAPTKVNWDADPNKLYVLVMTDPDAPARGAKLLGEVNHWMIVNIPGSDLDLSKGDTLADYGPPGPPRGTGPHRYVFVVYEQQGKFVPSPKYSERLTVTALAKRIKFSVKEFAKEFNLGEPVAANFFLSEYTPPRCELVY